LRLLYPTQRISPTCLACAQKLYVLDALSKPCSLVVSYASSYPSQLLGKAENTSGWSRRTWQYAPITVIKQVQGTQTISNNVPSMCIEECINIDQLTGHYLVA
jgi:hypothetical protein